MIHDGVMLAHYLAVHTAVCVCVQLQWSTMGKKQVIMAAISQVEKKKVKHNIMDGSNVTRVQLVEKMDEK